MLPDTKVQNLISRHTQLENELSTGNIDKKRLANGGRVLSITAKDKSLRSALSTIYDEVKKIDWNECYYRNDIGHKALKNEH